MKMACGSMALIMTFNIMFVKSACMAICIACAESPHTSQTYGRSALSLHMLLTNACVKEVVCIHPSIGKEVARVLIVCGHHTRASHE